MIRSKELDSVVIVIKALFMGLEVKVGDYTFTYNKDTDSINIKTKDLCLSGDLITLNNFIKIIHKEITEEEVTRLIDSMTVLSK